MPPGTANDPPGPEIMALRELDGIPCPCGTARRAFHGVANQACTLHLVEVSRESRAHYHKWHTEVYYVLKGEGHLSLDGQMHAVEPGMAAYIPPRVRHRAIPGDGTMEVLNFVTPPFDPEDEWFD